MPLSFIVDGSQDSPVTVLLARGTLIPEYREAVGSLDWAGRPIIGGKSMGGRVASMIADDLYGKGTIAGLLCLGHPFHPPGKAGQLRTAHLAGLATPTLICQATRDEFGTREEFTAYTRSPQIAMLWIEDGDHDLRPRKSVTGVGFEQSITDMAGKVAPGRIGSQRPSYQFAIRPSPSTESVAGMISCSNGCLAAATSSISMPSPGASGTIQL